MDFENIKNVTAGLGLDEKIALAGVPLSLVTEQIPKKRIFSVDLDAQSCYSARPFFALGCTFDRELAYYLGKDAFYSAVERKKAVSGVIDLGVIRNPMADGAEKMISEEPAAVTLLADSFINGAGRRVFADGLLGGENGYENRYIDPRALREIHLFPFWKLSRKLGGAFLPCGALNGSLCTESKGFADFVKKNLSREAPVLAKAGTVRDAVSSCNAGAGLIVGANKETKVKLRKSVESGVLHEGKLSAVLERLVAFTAAYYEDSKSTPPVYVREYDAEKNLARKSIVLLKNDAVLPLGALENVVVCGESDIADSLAAALNVPCVKEPVGGKTNIVCLSHDGKCFGHKSEKIIGKAGEGDIAVISAPHPVEIKELSESLSALVYVPRIFKDTASALSDILLGKFNPCGCLPVSWAEREGDYPCNLSARAKERGAYCFESVYNGQRYFSAFSKKVLFPFGHGLSYSRFAVSKPDLSCADDKYTLSFTVKNVSSVAGETVVFAFCEGESKNFFGLNKRLVGFTKVFLPAGESAPACIEIDADAVKVYSREAEKFVFPSGKFTLSLGFSGENVSAKVDLKLPKFGEKQSGPTAKEIPSYFAKDKFAPTGTEMEKVTGMPLVGKKPDYSEYVCAGVPSEKAVRAAMKRIGKSAGLAPDSRSLASIPQKVLENIAQSI